MTCPLPAPWTQLHWDTLLAIADGCVPSLTDEDATRVLEQHKQTATNPADDADILAFLKCKPSDNEAFLKLVKEIMGERLPERARGETRLFLNILTSVLVGAGLSLPVCRCPILTWFSSLSLDPHPAA